MRYRTITRERVQHLIKESRTRKLKKAELADLNDYKLQRIGDLIPELVAKYGVSDLLEVLVAHLDREQKKEFQKEAAWQIGLVGEGTTMIVNGLSLETEDRLRTFIEENIHTTYNEQQENLF